MFTENQKQSVPSLSLVSCGQPPPPPSSQKKKNLLQSFSFLFSLSFVVNSIYSWMLLPTFIQTKWKDPRHPIALLHPSLNKKRKKKYTSLSSRKQFLRMNSNVQCFLREGLHVAPYGRDRDPGINRPRSFSTVWKNGKRKRALCLSPNTLPPFQCRLVLGNGHFDQRLITVSCLPLYCPLISPSVEETSACCCLYNNGQT